MSVAIYTAVQSGDRSLAYYWVAIIMGISFSPFSDELLDELSGAERRWEKIMALYVDIEKNVVTFY